MALILSTTGCFAKLVDEILFRGFDIFATDIHISRCLDRTKIMYRSYKSVLEMINYPLDYCDRICNIFKLRANLDIIQKSNPQSGKASIHIGNSQLDFRVSTHPTISGELLTIRIMNFRRNLCQEELHLVQLLANNITRRSGVYIISGTTGSGKTSMMYALMQELCRSKVVVTIEDPAEMEIEGVYQTDINLNQITFEEAIKSLLRHSPDVLVIGEIRDKKPAEAMIKMAMTGMSVITTVHANSIYGTIERLKSLELDMEIISRNLACIIHKSVDNSGNFEYQIAQNEKIKSLAEDQLSQYDPVDFNSLTNA